MLIMTLAYAQRANDNAYLAQNYDILKQWTGYLVAEALIPANQISTDDFAGALPYATPSRQGQLHCADRSIVTKRISQSRV